MNKAEFINTVASKTGFSKKNTKVSLEATLEVITETLAKGDSVLFIGFGTFSTSQRAANTARVPGTDKIVEVPARKVAKFKVGKILKDSVRYAK
jgi:DNA-binding protein HU-beta